MKRCFYSSPIQRHPERSVIVWAVSRYLFALNLSTDSYECWRKTESDSSIHSIDFFYMHEKVINTNSFGAYLLATDDKTLVVLDDVFYEVRERFLLRKKPVEAAVWQNGHTIVLGDKFGDLFKLSFQDLGRSTSCVLYDVISDLSRNTNDITRLERSTQVLKRFENHRMVKQFLKNDMNIIKRDFVTEKENPLPFACHMAAITALKLTSNRSKIISADRDAKIRIGTVKNEHETLGYCLGHTELVTCLCCIDNSYLVSGSGDKTLRLWDIRDTAEELQCVQLDNIPLALFVTPDSEFILTLVEDIKGVLILRIEKKFCQLTLQSPKLLKLPNTPLGLLPVLLSPEELQHLCFRQLRLATFSENLGSGFYWVDETGKLHLPISISLEAPVFDETEGPVWLGEQIGQDITPESTILWKHNHEVF